MVFEEYNENVDAAEELREQGEFSKAGHHYTAAAYLRLGKGKYAADCLNNNMVDVSIGFRNLFAAALCYRLADQLERSQIRCQQGISLAEEMREYVFDYEMQKGVMYEYIGDFRLIGNLDNWKEAYTKAAHYYDGCENIIGWTAECEFDQNITFALGLARSVDYGIGRREKEQLKYESLRMRIDFKKNDYPEIIDNLISSGRW